MDFSAERVISEAELLPLIRERLAQGQSVRYLPFKGISMLPLLRQGKDSVELSPLPDKLKKYDLPVYQYSSGKIVMHRVVKVEGNHYVCLGDNTYEYEYIKPDQLIGLVTAIKRGEKRISVDACGYRVYSRVWCALFPLRRLYKRAKAWLRRRLKWINHL